MDIIQRFYDGLASQYDKLFLDWKAVTCEQADILKAVFGQMGFDKTSRVLDCACGIGTQAIGLACLGYDVTASDMSEGALTRARAEAVAAGVKIRFEKADFRFLSDTFQEQFDIVLAMDNALPHMLTSYDLERAIRSITDRIRDGGIFVGSIRDYDELLKTRPAYSPPYIHKTDEGQRVSFQTWEWKDDCYKLIQYIIDDREKPEVSRFECEYRATRREEITALFSSCGCSGVVWLFPEKTGFYQPIVVVRK